MGQKQTIFVNPTNGTPSFAAESLTKSFLSRHGAGLDDLLRRFNGVSGPEFRAAIERAYGPGQTTPELAIALDEAADTLLSLLGEPVIALEVDNGRRLEVDAGLRWYAARMTDLAKAARSM
ncbi:hypothetical protein SAMN05444413_1175 [Roseivivax marinus]|uniref:hypothetical protein n=1 Tax=Roseivivax marinus TaxID=1379903 RepID=UPI0008B6214F|nr:hypothetical protein [Roseivivax marinus]SEL81294.1 hypothetical protein SAMN05444413_1175 [Roseivivax marinus]